MKSVLVLNLFITIRSDYKLRWGRHAGKVGFN